MSKNVRTVEMTAEQAALIARALKLFLQSPNKAFLSDDEREELVLLSGCAEDTAQEEDEPTIHGWCL